MTFTAHTPEECYKKYCDAHIPLKSIFDKFWYHEEGGLGHRYFFVVIYDIDYFTKYRGYTQKEGTQ